MSYLFRLRALILPFSTAIRPQTIRLLLLALVLGLLALTAGSYAGWLVIEQSLDPVDIGPGPGQWVDYHVDTPLRKIGLFASACDDIAGKTEGVRRSELTLYENDRRLGPGRRFDAEIRDGGGAYSYQCLDDGASRGLAFSASDNSDPRHNGRHYWIQYPITVSPTVIIGLFVLLFILLQQITVEWIYRHNRNNLILRDNHLTKYEIIIIVIISSLFMIGWVLSHGETMSWDEKNYHIYIAYSWLNNRSINDIAPAQGQSWFNPLGYIPYYLIIEHLRPIFAGIVIGLLPAINLVLVYIIGWMMFERYSRVLRHNLVFMAVIIGGTGPTFLSEISTTYIDNITSIFILSALALAIRSLQYHDGDKRLPWLSLGMGLCLGLALGFKLTNTPFALGLGVAFLVCVRWQRLLLRVIPLGLLGLVTGLGIGGGYPAWLLWKQYGNPILPMFNSFFSAPLFPSVPFPSYAVTPGRLGDALAYPVSWFQLGMVTPDRPFDFKIFGYPIGHMDRYTSESPFYDCRFLGIQSLLVLVALVAAIRAMLARAHWVAFCRDPILRSEGRSWAFLAVFAVISYGAWIMEFGLSRYLLALELVTGLLIMVGLSMMAQRYRYRMLMMVLCTVFSVAWTRPMDWFRVPYGKTWFDITVPPALMTPNSLFVMVSGMPYSYIIPSFPQEDRFIRLTSSTLFFQPDAYLGRVIFQEIAAHRGPLWVLTAAPFNPEDLSQLARFKIDVDFEHCLDFTTNTDKITACPASHHTMAP